MHHAVQVMCFNLEITSDGKEALLWRAMASTQHIPPGQQAHDPSTPRTDSTASGAITPRKLKEMRSRRQLQRRAGRGIGVLSVLRRLLFLLPPGNVPMQNLLPPGNSGPAIEVSARPRRHTRDLWHGVSGGTCRVAVWGWRSREVMGLVMVMLTFGAVASKQSQITAEHAVRVQVKWYVANGTRA